MMTNKLKHPLLKISFGLFFTLILPAVLFSGEHNKNNQTLLHKSWERFSPISQWGSTYFSNGNNGFDDDWFVFRYNRVDGVFLGFRKKRETFRRRWGMQLYGGAGIGLKSERFQFQATLERSFFPAGSQFSIGGEIYDLTYTEDEWIIPSWENTLGAILIREDFQDFYRREGAGVYISQNFSRRAKLKIGWLEENHRSLDSVTNWSVFGGNKRFRDNPVVDNLELKGFYGEFQLDTRGRKYSSRRGWLFAGSAEYFTREYKGDTDFQRYIFEIRRYQPISRGENINIRLRAGETVGIVPVQKLFDLGGISTLRGYDYKAFTGDRMLLGNIEYQIDWDRLDWVPYIPILGEFNLILFADAGLAWYKDEKDFSKLKVDDLFSDIGIAFANYDGSFRLNIAKRTDRATDAVKITFRISRPF